MMGDDYIDELNWYTEGFGLDEQTTKAPKKEKTSRSSSSKSTSTSSSKQKEARVRKIRDSHVSKSSSSTKITYIDLDIPHTYQKPDVFNISKPERRSSKRREISPTPPPSRSKTNVLKRERPNVKLYEPVKTSGRLKEEIHTSSPTLHNTEKEVKNVLNKPSGKTEFVKIPEPPLSTFSKTAVNDKPSRGLTGKLLLLEERDKLIRTSMDKPSNLKQAQTVKGTCPDMCPEKERLMRSLKKMVSVFECLPNSNEMDPKLAIKEYARSSADQEEPLPHELRPEPVLTMSMSYIITKIITKFEECEDVSVWYDFCWNRLRAIRKDIVQQQLCDLETVTIVEQCARFHIVCFDRFWGADSTMFDEKINTENLMNCLKILLNLYGDLRKKGIICPNEPEFNAYMILIKMNSGDLLWEFINFPLSLQQTSLVIEAVKIYMFYNSNMYSQFFNYLLKTSYLNACLMQRCFTQLRVNALEAIVKAYCPPNKEGKVSLQHIMKSLKFDSKEDALSFCKSCNIRYIDRAGFKISHNTFVRPGIAFKISTPSSLVCNKRIEFAQAVVGVDYELPIYFEHNVHNSFINEKTLNGDALDASDQEEKMLRDNVERKLLLKNFKNSPTKLNQTNTNISIPSSPTLQRSLSSLSNRRKSVESDASSVKFVENPEPAACEDVDMDIEELSESDDYDMPDAVPVHNNNDQNLLVSSDNENIFEDAVDEVDVVPKEEINLEISSESDLGWQISPLSALSDEPLGIIEEEDEEEEVQIELLPTIPVEVKQHPTSPSEILIPSPSQNYSKTIFPSDLVSRNNLTPQSAPGIIERRISASSGLSINDTVKLGSSEITTTMMKLKSTLQLNLQRLSAKKYGRIWRERVREIKRSYGFVPLISHMNMKEYFSIWGHSISKQNTILNQLNNAKKLYSSVESLLFFNMFDTSTKHLCSIVSETLVDRKLRSGSDNIYGKEPIYWKLVISVPESKVTNYDLYQKVILWSKQVFFTSGTSHNTLVETTFCKGIKVHCKIIVTKGDKLNCGKNLSSLLFLRVPGWETSKESQNRLDQLISLANVPISVYIINLAPSDLLNPPSKDLVLFYSEISAGSKNFTKILIDLASNSYQFYVKSMHVCDLVDEMLDKFLDALQEDCFNNVAFSKALLNPSNIISLYNMLIDRLKNELIQNYNSNIYGTSNEIISMVTPNSKYNINLLPEIVREYFDDLILSSLQWPPTNSCDLLYIFKHFCERCRIPQVLSQVIRMINPPDDEQLFPLFLDDLNWLQIVEVIIKCHFRQKFCDVVVTYSEKSINNLIDSHWWMECKLILGSV